MNRWIRVFGAAAFGVAISAQTASAIPAFARKYRVSCAQCHAPVPRLNAFGEAFAANGFEFAPGEPPRDTIATGDPLLRLQNDLPLAIRFDSYVRALTDPKGSQNAVDLQAPWVIKLLSGGQVSDKVSYYFYFMMTEGGEIVGLEDAYIQYTDIANTGIALIAGQFQVSDPLFKRELRLPYTDYYPYKVRVGSSSLDLTYDRGLMALWSPREGTDVAVELLNGRGLSQAENDQYGAGDQKSTFVRLSQDVGPVRVGGFAYRGYELADDTKNTVTMWGPDATIPLGDVGEVNAQFVRRTDNDPFFGSCSVAAPCPGNMTVPFSTTVNSGMAEVILWPQGQAGRLFFTGLYNWVDSDHRVVSLDVGEQEDDPPFLSRYQSVAGGVHWLLHRNIRLMGEVGWDLDRDQARIVFGTVMGF